MSILKKIAVTALLSAVGIVLYRFVRIVVGVLREEFAQKSATKSGGPAKAGVRAKHAD